MAHALETYFDDEADAAVRDLWRRLADADLPSSMSLAPSPAAKEHSSSASK
jgi:hypothetical protein